MTREEKRLLLAMCIGDAHIKPTGEMCVQHSKSQRQYAEHKRQLVESIFGSTSKVVQFDNSGYPGVRWSKQHKYLRLIRKWLYRGGKKHLTRSILDKLDDHGIAIWFMDDGSLSEKKRDGSTVAWEAQISTYCSEEEALGIVSFFKERYDLTFTVKRHCGLYSVRCGTRAARVFCRIIDPYVIESMKYKTRILHLGEPRRILPNPTDVGMEKV